MQASVKSLLAFLRLLRPSFLAGGFAGGALGTMTAAGERGGVDFGAYALAQATITSFHLMTQVANEYFDRDGDRLGEATDYSGGSGALLDGTFAPAFALRAAAAFAALGFTGTATLWLTGHAVAAALSTAIAIGAWCYSAPPLRLCARGLGEADTALVVAALVPLAAFAAQTGGIDARGLAVTLPGDLAMLAMMLAVEIPDRRLDVAAGKRNLVVRLGRRAAGRLGGLAVAATFAAVPLAVWSGVPLAIVPPLLLLVPLAVALGRAFVSGDGRVPDEAVAGRGVAFFFLVSFGSIAGQAAVFGLH